MSRDEDHGGTWGFTNCVWAPTETRDGKTWPFWTKVATVREGEVVIHLRGVTPNANFVGYSIASSDGFRTARRPPLAGGWAYAQTFYRADLTGFTPFHHSINLTRLFASRREELEGYFEANKIRRVKVQIFFVRQAGRLQCLNGAYLSDVDDELLVALFGNDAEIRLPTTQETVVSVATGSQISTIRSRIGQTRFSDRIKALYGYRCCFPGCLISDQRFLVGSHIARWSDNIELRGQMGNGLCLCLLHDKAFELGLFTVDEQFAVFVNPREGGSESPIVQSLLLHQGEKIRLSTIKILDDALLEHWIRTGMDP